MISESLGNKVIEKALSKGGRFAEIFIENTKASRISMINGVVEKSVSGVDYGLGLRVFVGLNQIYAYTNDCTEKGLLALATSVTDAVSQSKDKGTCNITPLSLIKHENIHNIILPPDKTPKSDIVSFLKEASNVAYDFDEKITQTSAGYYYVIQDVAIMNSEGLYATDRRVRNRVSFTSVASDGSEKQTSSYNPGGLKGFEFVEDLEPSFVGIKTAKTAVKMLSAQYCPSGTMPVVIANGFGGVIFHEACGHSLEATSVAKGASVFTNKIGEQIASSKVTAIDDGTIANAWGSTNIDDEGSKTQKNILIKDGILNSYLVDKLNGERMNAKMTGSGRRESYRFAPTSRMNNTYIDCGTDTFDDMVSNTENGLFAKSMGGGSVEPATGDFNFAVNEGYLIENGKITVPVRGATLIGRGSEVLMNIDYIGTDLATDQGMCGSLSGSVPTDVGQPTLRVSEMIVGGRA